MRRTCLSPFSKKESMKVEFKGKDLVLPQFSRFLCISFVALLAACSSKNDEKYEEKPVEELYNKALSELKEKKYVKAADLFDEVERQHPYSHWATLAQVNAAYSHYMAQRYEKALAALEGFLQLHPAHEDVPYALYLRGQCYYEQVSSVERDQKITEIALDSYQELIRRFPNSRYAKDAKFKVDLLRDMLAAKHMDIGRYYQDQKSYLAAMNRFREVVKDYQTTGHTPEALHRLVEVYLALGLKHEALATASVLGHNFPGSEWYADSYKLLKDENLESAEPADSWIRKIWK